MIDLKPLVAILQDNKMKNISIYDNSSEGQERLVIVCSSAKIVDSKKTADAIAEKYHYEGKIEGYFKGEWIVFDFANVTLHIFLTKVREKYNLDKLYKPKKVEIK